MKNELQVLINKSGLEKTKAQILLDRFTDYFKIASEWENKAKIIKVTNEKQTTEMKMAREGRLFLREKRIAIEKTRKELKEGIIREGKAIEGIANVLKSLIIPIEEYLYNQEHFIEIKKAHEEELKRIEAEKKAEEETIKEEKRLEEKRIQKQIADEKERIRLKKQNAKLQKLAEKKEKQLQKERKIANEKLLAQQKIADEKIAKEKEELQKKLDKQIECPYCHKKFMSKGLK